MLYSTNSVIDFAKQVFLKEIDMDKYEDDALVKKYYFPLDFSDDIIDISIKRLFVLHNFQRGFMIVQYTHQVLDSETGLTITGSIGIVSKWTIEKRDNRWVVTDIEERP